MKYSGLLHHTVSTVYSKPLEEHTAHIFRMTGLVQNDDEETQWMKIYQLHERFERIWSILFAHP
jgi:hypothetical protein